jgi:hypothetical protein
MKLIATIIVFNSVFGFSIPMEDDSVFEYSQENDNNNADEPLIENQNFVDDVGIPQDDSLEEISSSFDDDYDAPTNDDNFEFYEDDSYVEPEQQYYEDDQMYGGADIYDGNDVYSDVSFPDFDPSAADLGFM